jgi:hypothetical protein
MSVGVLGELKWNIVRLKKIDWLAYIRLWDKVFIEWVMMVSQPKTLYAFYDQNPN